MAKKQSAKSKNELTDNVRFNELMSPYYFAIIFSFFYFVKDMPLMGKISNSTIIWASISTLFYLFCSNYFQPDLDQMSKRPGMGHFPLGRWIGAYKIGRILKMLVYPINRVWYYFWHPYGRAFTHRGVNHYPFIGAWLRVGYIYLAISLIGIILDFLFYEPNIIKNYKDFLKSFYPWDKNFGNFYFFVFFLPIYLSDIVHILVDYYDSKRRGISFCPPKIPRGFFAKLWNTLRGKRI